MNTTVMQATWAEIAEAIRQRTPQRGTVMSCGRISCSHDDVPRTVDFATVEVATRPFTDCRIVIPIEELCKGATANPRLAIAYLGREIQFVPLDGNESSRIVVGSRLRALMQGEAVQA